MAKNNDTVNGLRNVGIAFLCFLIIACIGITESWAIIPVSAALCGGMAWVFKKNVVMALAWAGIGLIAGICWHTFGV